MLISDQESYSNHIGIIRRIIGYENNIQRDYAGISFYHVNGEQIEIGMVTETYIYIQRCNINELCSIVILLFSSSVNIFVHVCLSDGLSVSTESFVSSVDKSDRLFEICSYNVRNIWTSYVEYEHSNLFYLTRITVINNKI